MTGHEGFTPAVDAPTHDSVEQGPPTTLTPDERLVIDGIAQQVPGSTVPSDDGFPPSALDIDPEDAGRRDHLVDEDSLVGLPPRIDYQDTTKAVPPPEDPRVV